MMFVIMIVPLTKYFWRDPPPPPPYSITCYSGFESRIKMSLPFELSCTGASINYCSTWWLLVMLICLVKSYN